MRVFGKQFQFADILGRNRLMPGGVVDQSDAATREAQASNDPKAALYDDQAILSQFIFMITRFPDPDEVLRQAGISRKQLAVLMTDDEVYQTFDTRRDAVLGTPLRLELRAQPTKPKGKDATPASSDKSGIEGDEFAQFLLDQLASIKTVGIPGIWNAVPYGYSVVEAVYTNPDDPREAREDGRIGLKTFLEKPFWWFEPKADGSLRYYPDNGSAGDEGILCDQQFKFFLTRRRPTYLNPFGEALLSRLYWPWFFRYNGWKFWSKFVERFGAPLLVGMTDNTEAMTLALLQAHSSAVISIGKEDKIDAVGGAGVGGGDAFDRFESASIRRIQKVVLGQTLTSGTDGGSGNRALGQVHETVRRDKLDSDLELITPTIQRLVDALCVLNGKAAGTYTAFYADDTGLEADRATRDVALMSSKRIAFTKAYFINNYDFREDDILVDESEPTSVVPTPGGQVVDEDGNDPAVSGKPAVPPKAAAKAPPLNKANTPASRVLRAALETFSHQTRTTRFTHQQNIVEDLADEALEAAGKPIAAEVIRSAVFAATDPEDLESRLLALIGPGTLDAEQFRAVLETALFTADVLGYVHADNKV